MTQQNQKPERPEATKRPREVWYLRMKWWQHVLVVIGLLFVWFVLAGPAQANPYMVRYEQAATTLWGPVPADQCPTGVEYLFPPSDPFALPVDDPDTPEDDTVEATARAELNGCEVWLIFWPRLEGDRIDRWWVYAQNMATVLHEWRHLQGFDHDVRGLNNWGDTDRQAVRYAEALATARYGDPDVVTLGASKPVRKHRSPPAVKRCRGSCATFAKDFDDGSTPDPIKAGGHLRKR